jgi:excisionase family DNA binding protein
MNSNPERLLVTINVACDTLGVGRTTVYTLLARGKLGGVKIGRRTLIVNKSIEDLLESLPKWKGRTKICGGKIDYRNGA